MFLVTGDGDPAVRASAADIGATVVRKPVDVDQLFHAVLASRSGASAPC